MRVLFLLLEPELSGRTRAFASAARALAARGHPVTVVYPSDAPGDAVLEHASYEVQPIRAGGP